MCTNVIKLKDLFKIRNMKIKSWKDIDIKKYSLLSDLKETGNEVTDFLQKIMILENKPIDEVEKYNLANVMELNKQLSFMKKLPEEKLKKWFIHNWKVYRIKDIPNLTNKDFFNLNDIIEKEQNDGLKLAKVMNVLYQPVVGKSAPKDLMGLDIETAYGCVLFFYRIERNFYLKYLETSLVDLMNLKGKEIQKIEETTGETILQIMGKMQKAITNLKNGNGISSPWVSQKTNP